MPFSPPKTSPDNLRSTRLYPLRGMSAPLINLYR